MSRDDFDFRTYERLRAIDARLRELEPWIKSLREVRQFLRDATEELGREPAFHRRQELAYALENLHNGYDAERGTSPLLVRELEARGWTPVRRDAFDVLHRRPGLRAAESELEKLREERAEIAEQGEEEGRRRAAALGLTPSP